MAVFCMRVEGKIFPTPLVRGNIHNCPKRLCLRVAFHFKRNGGVRYKWAPLLVSELVPLLVSELVPLLVSDLVPLLVSRPTSKRQLF